MTTGSANSISIENAASALGAIVRGVDLSAPLSADMVHHIRTALLTHLLLVFPEQRLTPHDLAAAAAHFGPLQPHDYVPSLPEHPCVIEVRRERNETKTFGGAWHSDNSYLEKPPMASMLYAVEVPASGGDTLWSNQYAAYDALPDRLRLEIETQSVLHAADIAFADMGAKERPLTAVHPLVRRHPETGRKALFHSGVCTRKILSRSDEDSAALLNEILAHATQPQFTYRHRWGVGDVVIWDNRCTMHLALGDYEERRIMHRVSIAGDRPRLG